MERVLRLDNSGGTLSGGCSYDTGNTEYPVMCPSADRKINEAVVL